MGPNPPLPSVSTHISSSVPWTSMRGPRTRFTFEMKKQVHFPGPSIVSVFICRHLPQETNDLTNSCVTEKENVRERVWERGCPRSLVTICLRRSSCQLLFSPVIQFSLSLPVQGSHMVWAATSQHRSILDMYSALFLLLSLWVFCVPLCFCVRSVSMPPLLTAGLCSQVHEPRFALVCESTRPWNTNALFAASLPLNV